MTTPSRPEEPHPNLEVLGEERNSQAATLAVRLSTFVEAGIVSLDGVPPSLAADLEAFRQADSRYQAAQAAWLATVLAALEPKHPYDDDPNTTR